MLIDLRSPDRFATKYEDNAVHVFFIWHDFYRMSLLFSIFNVYLLICLTFCHKWDEVCG